MIIKRVAGRDLTRIASVALVAVAVVVAMFAAEPASAAVSGRQQPVLAEGVGMGAKPSPAVRRMQRQLDRRGYDLGAPGVDGRFGPLTAGAVRRLQRNSGITVDGVVGPQTRRTLRSLNTNQQTAKPKATAQPQATAKPKPKANAQPQA